MIKAKLLQYGFFKQSPYIVFTTTLDKSLELVKPIHLNEITEVHFPHTPITVYANAKPNQYKIENDVVKLDSFNLQNDWDDLPCLLGLYKALRDEVKVIYSQLAITFIVEILPEVDIESDDSSLEPVELFETSF